MQSVYSVIYPHLSDSTVFFSCSVNVDKQIFYKTKRWQSLRGKFSDKSSESAVKWNKTLHDNLFPMQSLHFLKRVFGFCSWRCKHVGQRGYPQMVIKLILFSTLREISRVSWLTRLSTITTKDDAVKHTCTRRSLLQLSFHNDDEYFLCLKRLKGNISRWGQNERWRRVLAFALSGRVQNRQTMPNGALCTLILIEVYFPLNRLCWDRRFFSRRFNSIHSEFFIISYVFRIF